ncbi:Thermosensitive gluconokinase [Gluconacetobacter sp. SXCC-1]|uniref:Gluconokinase n=1 Tax=Komagataeibacter rhaeticus TaxID=215221 RepID=A0A181CC68_9PROT|nr:gluconokinase, GntK/IdnK-type [Komagataeibacter rhaeticus]ATU72017.1 carbohydrate kinase [Komagataeibacter xylinus]EGG75438.1 Thermosensitive gluconokinase [Gluconacetobacter sp. SXCC-1]QIP35860.1 AAA family ATPase [Komagataeibacter rhaeticus]QOC45620.1 AAA family ATPase [Komagataeibacter rhaeticus]WPP21716.1 gluconokinase, GntK/IdnK-type [Komagataeibacter rhaeticus]
MSDIGQKAVTVSLSRRLRQAGRPCVLIVMGVSGCGKSTVAQLMAGHLGWPVIEGDDLHTASNIARMSSGIPLTDADRAPWLDRIAAQVAAWGRAGQCGIVTCSSLKRKYREHIAGGSAAVCFVYLKGSREDIAPRLRQRTGHFMPVAMLDSQFATLEEPDMEEEVVMALDVNAAQDHLARQACAHLAALPG